LEIIKSDGFEINYRKTKYQGDQTITGINVFNNYIDAPDTIIVKAREEELLNKKTKPYSNYLALIRQTNTRKKEENR